MCGLVSFCSDSTSRRNRSTNPGSRAIVAESTLTATGSDVSP